MTDNPFLPPEDDELEAPFPESAAPAEEAEDARSRTEPAAPPAPEAQTAAAPAVPPAPAARLQPGRPRRDDRGPARGPKPDLLASVEPLYRDNAGYRMRLEPPDLARLRELPGSKGKTDQELGETFFDGQAERFSASLSEDVPTPADVRVVIDPYSRQAFLAVEKKIRSIVSF
ncbi:MAG TPA: hypothetical protein VE007_02145 [Thermoanaerobaculia bacterium]|nr:hypothetical protein [Thermoanaerobaculia bacterium]